jgi:endo-1,3(4)-beta-glucanase
MSFYKQYESQILDLVQDVANPDWDDNFFTVVRHKDWYAGHSWANGLFGV